MSYFTMIFQFIIIGGQDLSTSIPYSRKYWQELKLVVGPQIAIVKILADLNLAVW